MQSIFSNALIRGGSKTHRLVGNKARDAVVAGALDHAARNDMPVAAGGVCGERGADLSLFTGKVSLHDRMEPRRADTSDLRAPFGRPGSAGRPYARYLF